MSGRGRLAVEVRDLRDRVVASDPGLAHLRRGIGAVVAVGTTAAVEALVVRVIGAPSRSALLAIMLGAVIAMTLATSVRENDRRVAGVTIALGAVAAAVGATVGVVTAQVHVVGLVAFTIVSFVAVWMRRFGPRWFALGFVGWQAFFFSLFLDPPVAALPLMGISVLVATAWVALLMATVLHIDPAGELRATVTALRARARAAVSAAIEVLDDPDDLGAVRAMRGQLIGLSEVSLLLDGQLSRPHALPAGLSAGFVRRWVVDVEIGMDELCGAVLELARARGEGEPPPEPVLREVREVLASLGWEEGRRALGLAQRLRTTTYGGVAAARRVGAASVLLLETVDQWDHPALRGDASDEVLDDADDAEDADDGGDAPRGADDRDGGEGGDDHDTTRTRGRGRYRGRHEAPRPAGRTRPGTAEPEFEPVVTLFSGNLPGTAPLAERTHESEGVSRWSPSRWRLTTRQAVQAAVAAGLSIVLGELISPQRYYWAVIASFIAFTGTATTSETIRKSIGRIVGTLAGLVAAVGLAALSSGSSTLSFGLLLVCVFLAFYLQTLSNTALTFFITLMLGQLYALLHTFSDQLLLLRLAETAVGAVVGIGVSLVVLPSGSRATLKVARQSFLTSLGATLDACADRLAGRADHPDLIALVVQAGADARQVVRTHRALTRGRVFGAGREQLRRRISVLGSADAVARTLAARVEATPLPVEPGHVELAEACRLVADEARRLAALPTLVTGPPRGEHDGQVLARVGALLDAAPPDEATERLRPLVRRLADTLALLVPRTDPVRSGSTAATSGGRAPDPQPGRTVAERA
ncbi:fusaric acid resistance family protein [Lapillicoccus jejuensis]|uniref:Fusaric acid resistance family protein n=1 Tax=Lapillicoccus jejuensis TaxID=402171 RepID=A0A542E4R6_9MICO|nr:fusaric acid resistance family protein [Lapillicoccus jejuensis]